MSHMVIYRSAEGKPAYHQTEELADAASFVERLRNEEGVESARIFRLDEIIFDFKTVYRVRISGNDEVAARTSAELAATPVVTQPMPAQQVSTSTPTPQPAPPVSSESVGSTSMSSSASASPSGATSTGAMSDDISDDVDSAGNGARRGLFGR